MRGLNKSEICKAFASVSFGSSLLYLKLCGVESQVSQLRASISATNGGFTKLSGRQIFSSRGWLKFVEVVTESGKVRPVVHCLSIVPPSYFGSKYISKARWAEAWRECMGSSHALGISTKCLKKAGVELPLSLQQHQSVTDSLWFAELSEQLYKMRFFSAGGSVKNHLKLIQTNASSQSTTEHQGKPK
jgi:Replication protein